MPEEVTPKLSRQRIYALRRKAEGKCRICGQPRVEGNKNFCEKHVKQVRAASRKFKGFRPWHPGGVGRPPHWAKEAISDIEKACGVDRAKKAKEFFDRTQETE